MFSKQHLAEQTIDLWCVPQSASSSQVILQKYGIGKAQIPDDFLSTQPIKHHQNPSTPHFNISHSQTATFVAVTAGGPIGLDCEPVGRSFDATLMLTHNLSKREQRLVLRQLPQKRATLMLLFWTQKEAFLKAIGTGIQQPLSEIDIGYLPSESTLISQRLLEQNFYSLCLQTLCSHIVSLSWQPCTEARQYSLRIFEGINVEKPTIRSFHHPASSSASSSV